MLMRSRLSCVLITVVLTFVTLICCARDYNQDWQHSALPNLQDPGPDSVIVDTTGMAHIYNSSSNWHCWGTSTQGWQTETIHDDVICLDMATEENEIHAAFITTTGNVYYQWRSPGTTWHRELIESFRAGSIERVEIEKSPDGNLWLAVLYNDIFYLYGHTDDGWNDYVVETMAAQFKDQSLWRLEIDWNNQIQLVRQISPIGFYHITGTPGDWTTAIINNIEEFPGDSREFELKGMDMRKDNTPILHVSGKVPMGENTEYFTGAIVNNQGDWEAAEAWSDYYGATAYDYARDRIHCMDVQGYDESRYWSVPLSRTSREAYQPLDIPAFEGICCLTIGRLDLPHAVVWDGGRYVYHSPVADIHCYVNMAFSNDNTHLNYGYGVINWKWDRKARVGFLMEIAGHYYWAPNWTETPHLQTSTFDTGRIQEHLLDAPAWSGEYGIDVTFYTALLDPVEDLLLNGACWDAVTVTY